MPVPVGQPRITGRRVREMKDLIELANLIDRELPEKKQKEEFCDLFLKELGTLKARIWPHTFQNVFSTWTFQEQ